MTMRQPTVDDLNNIERYLATPAIFTASMTPQEIAWEFQRMAERTLITREFVQGRITPDQFENSMHELGVDIYHAQEQWEQGVKFF